MRWPDADVAVDAADTPTAVATDMGATEGVTEGPATGNEDKMGMQTTPMGGTTRISNQARSLSLIKLTNPINRKTSRINKVDLADEEETRTVIILTTAEEAAAEAQEDTTTTPTAAPPIILVEVRHTTKAMVVADVVDAAAQAGEVMEVKVAEVMEVKEEEEEDTEAKLAKGAAVEDMEGTKGMAVEVTLIMDTQVTQDMEMQGATVATVAMANNNNLSSMVINAAATTITRTEGGDAVVAGKQYTIL